MAYISVSIRCVSQLIMDYNCSRAYFFGFIKKYSNMHQQSMQCFSKRQTSPILHKKNIYIYTVVCSDANNFALNSQKCRNTEESTTNKITAHSFAK